MSTTTIRGINVSFPFTPYDLQVKYMDKVIECLENRQNGVLESPTGTGKTLSLLCSSLAWLEARKANVKAERGKCFDGDSVLLETFNNINQNSTSENYLKVPQIFYAARTHSQLLQAMQEMKRTKYNHFKAVILGSRDQMCIHEEVMNEESNSMKTASCANKVRNKSCEYYNRVEKRRDKLLYNTLNIIDIEDIVKIGMDQKFCPFFTAKGLMHFADIIFTPYNYLLDSRIRKSLEINLKNSVIILDEGHNVEKTCEECASSQLKSTDITSCIKEVTAVAKVLRAGDLMDDEIIELAQDVSVEELEALIGYFTEFENVLNNIPITSGLPEGTHFDGTYIFKILEKAGITDFNVTPILSLIDKLTARRGRKVVGLQMFSDLLTLVFSNSQDQKKIKDCYKVHIAMDDSESFGNKKFFQTTKGQIRVLNYWCFNPGFGMHMLMDLNIYCLILTSGTLAPLKPLISELDLKVEVRIENPHIVEGDQVCVKILTKGPDGEPLSCSYANRDNPNYLRSLGQVISNLLRFIPDGVLIFFPSYPIMFKCQKFWKEAGMWESIVNIKPTYMEPRDKNSFKTAMMDYYDKINNPLYKGAVFMGVCRGKISEGLDFDDANGRAVFVVGLPYPPLKDPKIILKKRYLDLRNSQNREYLNGDDWYSLEASRAVNQAIGRVVRHKSDYGAIILLDSRFTNPRVQSNFSSWLKKHVKIVNFGEAVRELREFFKKAREKFPIVTKMEIQQESNFDDISNLPATYDASLVHIHKRPKMVVDNNIFKKN